MWDGNESQCDQPIAFAGGASPRLWSRRNYRLSNCDWRLACPSAVLLRAFMGTLNSRLQSVQTPTAGVVLSHLATLRRRWIHGLFFLGRNKSCSCFTVSRYYFNSSECIRIHAPTWARTVLAIRPCSDSRGIAEQSRTASGAIPSCFRAGGNAHRTPGAANRLHTAPLPAHCTWSGLLARTC